MKLLFALYLLAAPLICFTKTSNDQWKTSLGYALKHYTYWQSRELGTRGVDTFIPNQITGNFETVKKKDFHLMTDIESNRVKSRSKSGTYSRRLNKFDGGIHYKDFFMLFSWKDNLLLKDTGEFQLAKYSVLLAGLGVMKEFRMNHKSPAFLRLSAAYLLPISTFASEEDLRIKDIHGHNKRISIQFQKYLKTLGTSDIYLDIRSSLTYLALTQKIQWEGIETRLRNSTTEFYTSAGLQLRF